MPKIPEGSPASSPSFLGGWVKKASNYVYQQAQKVNLLANPVISVPNKNNDVIPSVPRSTLLGNLPRLINPLASFVLYIIEEFDRGNVLKNAIDSNKVDVVKFYLSRKNIDGKTLEESLRRAIQGGNIEIVESILESTEHWAPSHLVEAAKTTKNNEVFSALLKKIASFEGSKPEIRKILEYLSHENDKTESLKTLLQQDFVQPYIKEMIIRILIEDADSLPKETRGILLEKAKQPLNPSQQLTSKQLTSQLLNRTQMVVILKKASLNEESFHYFSQEFKDQIEDSLIQELTNKATISSRVEIITEKERVNESITKKSSKKLHRLSQSIVDYTRSLLTSSNLATMEKPSSGVTKARVHLTTVKARTNDLPLVIRVEKDKENAFTAGLSFDELLSKRQAAQDLIQENGFNHLVVPKSSPTDSGFLIEERLPNLKGYPFAHMAYYSNNYRDFDEAAVELASFLSQIKLGDIIGGNGSYLNALWANGALRFDNLLIYQGDDGKGKVGLIDLDELGSKRDTPNYREGARIAIAFFPHQYDLIMKSFEDKYTFTDAEIHELRKKQQESLRALEMVVGDHYKYLKEANISLHESQVSEKIRGLNLDELTSELLEDFRHIDPEFDWYSDYIGTDPDSISKNIQIFREASLPRMLSYFTNLANQKLNEAKNLSDYEILAKRKLMIQKSDGRSYNAYLQQLGVRDKLTSEEEQLETGGLEQLMLFTIAKKLIEKGVFGSGVICKKEDADSTVALIF